MQAIEFVNANLDPPEGILKKFLNHHKSMALRLPQSGFINRFI